MKARQNLEELIQKLILHLNANLGCVDKKKQYVAYGCRYGT